MLNQILKLSCLLVMVVSLPSFAQVAVTASVDHQKLLASHDPKLAANKKLVYDFWREVFEAGHLELAENIWPRITFNTIRMSLRGVMLL